MGRREGRSWHCPHTEARKLGEMQDSGVEHGWLLRGFVFAELFSSSWPLFGWAGCLVLGQPQILRVKAQAEGPFLDPTEAGTALAVGASEEPFRAGFHAIPVRRRASSWAVVVCQPSLTALGFPCCFRLGQQFSAMHKSRSLKKHLLNNGFLRFS